MIRTASAGTTNERPAAGTGGVMSSCKFCGGSDAHRKARIARDESLRECARRMGVTAAQLSAYEHGRAGRLRLRELLAP